ncbi:peptide ABC transporter substrate-binding protein [Cytobacillus sp. S13-E01]|uniref:peptide ABC transporter substrate-binding protein n=1 Tax=Cytobacillus sp. S13-E01 TaxID=3031326 RepID=UPI0023D8A891|nr:peptide ABC transporter substrate-binding protein [Cytobacillus sp. S13-E01]MDF0725403.1 peptide ABC transporter substrate-binding protein [Cytobacillus sp. S13-E01]
MKEFTRKSLIVLVLLAATILISACSSEKSSGKDNENEKPDSTDAGVEQTLTVNALTEPPSLDPPLIDNRMAGEIANQLFEGLVRLDESGKAVPGVAKEWNISDDGLVYTFYLNENAKWSNGNPVTAEDFFYSWERTLRPETAAPLVSNLYFIKNAVLYNSGELTDPTQLGMKVINDNTFEVTLEKPTSFFLGLTSFFSVLPINKEVAESNPKWATEADSFVSNGPFKLKSWDHGQEIVMVPNENYWAADVVKLEELKWVMVNEQNTEYGMYKSGELDVSNNFPNGIKSDLIASGEAKNAPQARTYYLRYNYDTELFGNEKIRRALGLALNRQLIVDKVTQGGETPALAFIPPGLGSGDGEFRSLAGDALYKDNDVETAKQLLKEGLEELGLSSFPNATLLFQTNDTYNKLTQAMQEMWKQNLGIDITLQTMEQKVFIQTVKSGDFELAIYSTGADYDDASNLMGQYTTGDIYNYSNISIPSYDELIAKVDIEVDLQKRAQYMVEAEKILLDAMAIAPLYYGTDVFLQKENVKGIIRFPIQAIDYREAYKE